MFLNSLEISNYRSFEKIQLDFKDRITVIVGKNGSGKTSILEAAAISIGTLFSAFPNLLNLGIRKSDARYKYFDMGSGIDVQPQYPVQILASGEICSTDITWERDLTTENGRTTRLNAKEMVELSKKLNDRLMNGDKQLVLPLIAYYGTGRLWDQHQEKKSDVLKKNTRTNGYIDSLDGTANIKLMLKWFQKMAKKDAEHIAPCYEYSVVKEAIESFFSSITDSTETFIGFNFDTLEIEVSYRTADQKSVKIPLNYLSDGYRCAVSLVADIAYRMATLNPALLDKVITDTDGIVLIDEIDLHLHPAWQQKILSELRRIFPKLQFIVTTHAPAVINSVTSNSIIILDKGIPKTLDTEIYGRDVNGVLKSLMDVNERPEPVALKFQEFYTALDNNDFTRAEKILNDLETEIGYDDTEIASCRISLDLERL